MSLAKLNKDHSMFEEQYMNMMQMQANIADTNVLIGEIGRAAGKTEGIFGPRMIKVGYAMPRETSFVVHKTYVALLTNIIPNIKAYFNTPYGEFERPRMEEGLDYVIGESKLPKHFIAPRRPVTYPKHSLIFRTGHNFQLVASDQPDSVAGSSGVHAFVEEMKHNKGEKLKSRLFPALRGAPPKIRASHYYQGITAVSDTARVDLGEDNWFEEYEDNMNEELVSEIMTVAKHVNDAMVRDYQCAGLLKKTHDEKLRHKLLLEQKKAQRDVELWSPRLNRMRRNATFYIRASSFVNKDFLGKKFFQTQLETLSMEEFLVAICAVRIRRAENLFFVGLHAQKHFFANSYKYNNILSVSIKDTFKLDASYLSNFQAKEPLLLGYDPGTFQSIVVGQEWKEANELRIIKDFHVWGEKDQADLAREIYEYFGQHHQSKEILLYYDRAGNKRRELQDQITTDANLMAKELRSYGFRVKLMNEKQKTIFYYQHYKLLGLILGEKLNSIIKLRVCENECKNLKSSMFITAMKKTEGNKIEMDKAAEKKLPWRMQAALSPQLASALTYLIYSRYKNQLPNDMQSIPDLPSTIAL